MTYPICLFADATLLHCTRLPFDILPRGHRHTADRPVATRSPCPLPPFYSAFSPPRFARSYQLPPAIYFLLFTRSSLSSPGYATYSHNRRLHDRLPTSLCRLPTVFPPLPTRYAAATTTAHLYYPTCVRPLTTTPHPPFAAIPTYLFPRRSFAPSTCLPIATYLCPPRVSYFVQFLPRRFHFFSHFPISFLAPCRPFFHPFPPPHCPLPIAPPAPPRAPLHAHAPAPFAPRATTPTPPSCPAPARCTHLLPHPHPTTTTTRTRGILRLAALYHAGARTTTVLYLLTTHHTRVLLPYFRPIATRHTTRALPVLPLLPSTHCGSTFAAPPRLHYHHGGKDHHTTPPPPPRSRTAQRRTPPPARRLLLMPAFCAPAFCCFATAHYHHHHGTRAARSAAACALPRRAAPPPRARCLPPALRMLRDRRAPARTTCRHLQALRHHRRHHHRRTTPPPPPRAAFTAPAAATAGAAPRRRASRALPAAAGARRHSPAPPPRRSWSWLLFVLMPPRRPWFSWSCLRLAFRTARRCCRLPV